MTKATTSEITKTLKFSVAFNNGFFTTVPAFRQGHLHISPVDLDSILFNAGLFAAVEQEGHEDTVTLHGKKALLTHSAKEALDLALEQLQLALHQEVWIVTTTGNTYISSCVTTTIQKHCEWSRAYSSKTAAILVNHEFGFCYADMRALRKYNLPIIEDCAYSMYSNNSEKSAGNVGDFVIYSMAKMFPVSSGGLLLANGSNALPKSSLSKEEQRYFHAVFTHYHKHSHAIIAQRRSVFQIFTNAFAALGLHSRFDLAEGDVPGAFLFQAPNKDLVKLKSQLQNLGIECSVFYGEDTFYLPCHQRMTESHVQYLSSLIKTILLC